MPAPPAAPEPDRTYSVAPRPPGATYETNASCFRASVRSPARQGWFVTPLTLLWFGVCFYAFAIAPKRPDDPISNVLLIASFAALIGIPLAASVILSKFGRLTVFSNGVTGVVREHIGGFGTQREFSWEALASVCEVERPTRLSRVTGLELDLSRARAKRRIYWAMGAPEPARRFLIAVLEAEIRAGRHSHPLGLDV